MSARRQGVIFQFGIDFMEDDVPVSFVAVFYSFTYFSVDLCEEISVVEFFL